MAALHADVSSARPPGPATGVKHAVLAHCRDSALITLVVEETADRNAAVRVAMCSGFRWIGSAREHRRANHNMLLRK